MNSSKHNHNYHYYNHHQGPTMRCKNGKTGKAGIQFPRRDNSQRSSTAKSSKELGEPSHGAGPKVTKLQRRRESWLSPYGTRSNLVSPCNGRVNTPTFIGNWNSRNRLGPYNTTTIAKHNQWKPIQPPQQLTLCIIGCIQEARIEGVCDHHRRDE